MTYVLCVSPCLIWYFFICSYLFTQGLAIFVEKYNNLCKTGLEVQPLGFLPRITIHRGSLETPFCHPPRTLAFCLALTL